MGGCFGKEGEEGLEVQVGGVWGSELSHYWEPNYGLRQCCRQKKSSRGVEKVREGSLGVKKKTSQSSNRDAELDVAKRPGGGQKR